MAALFNFKAPFGPKAKTGRINLLPQEEFAASTKGRILMWLLGTFRVIVIITEVVVMGAFLSRFWLDARVADLNEEIEQKKAIIASTAEFEQNFRDIQQKLGIVASISASEEIPSKIVEALASKLPNDVTLSSITYGAGQIRLTATSPSEFGIAQYIANLKTFDLFDSVELSQMDSTDNLSLLIFDLRIKLKGGK